MNNFSRKKRREERRKERRKKVKKFFNKASEFLSFKSVVNKILVKIMNK